MTDGMDPVAEEAAADLLHARWSGWLKTVHREIVELHHHRHIWSELRDAIVANDPAGDGTFLAHHADLYVAHQAMTLRRLLDGRTDSISFRRLLKELQRQPEVMTRERYVALWDGDDHRDETDSAWRRRQANATFDRFSGPGGPHLTREFVDADVDRLHNKLNRVRRLADKVLAHRDPGDAPPLTFAELDDAVMFTEELLTTYTLLFEAASLSSATPVMQGDWKAPFRRAVFPPFTDRRPSPDFT